MRFSVFTPTHDPEYLEATYRSLKAQTFADWEWVILPNNDCPALPRFDDRRVRVLPCVKSMPIGALKNMVCMACQGEYLVELDHDDVLVTAALEVIDVAIHRTGAGFLYSDCAQFADGDCQVFGKDYGWEHYERDIDGRTYYVNEAFPLTPASLHDIGFAPDHVRVWNANVYREIGGHDVTLRFVDDGDLICRTYLSGAGFHHINDCLYLYRLHDSNTSAQHYAELRATGQRVANQYLYPVIDEWCRRNGLLVYDMDVNAALGGRLPFENGTVGCIRAVDCFDRVRHCRGSMCSHGECATGLMNEIHRALAPSGWLVSATPSTDEWNPEAFWSYTSMAQYVPDVTARFHGTRVWQAKRQGRLYVYADLVCLKGQRHPGTPHDPQYLYELFNARRRRSHDDGSPRMEPRPVYAADVLVVA